MQKVVAYYRRTSQQSSVGSLRRVRSPSRPSPSPQTTPASAQTDENYHHTSPAWSSLLWTESAKCRHRLCTLYSSVYSRVGLCDPLRFTSFEMVACWMVQLTNGRPLPRLGLSGDNRGGSSFVSPFPSRPALILNSPFPPCFYFKFPLWPLYASWDQ